MRLGDRILVGISGEGREAYGTVIEILPHSVELLCDDDTIRRAPYQALPVSESGAAVKAT